MHSKKTVFFVLVFLWVILSPLSSMGEGGGSVTAEMPSKTKESTLGHVAPSKSHLTHGEYRAGASSSLPQKNSRIIIFDWDDTFLPLECVEYKETQSTKKAGYFHTWLHLYKKCEEFLPEIEEAVRDLLQVAIKNGHVFIVTNAEAGWVQLSAKLVFPSLIPLLEQVEIRSAQTEFRPLYGDNVNWKYYSFQKILNELHPLYPNQTGSPEKIKHVFSIGDSESERSALMQNYKERLNFWNKTYKLVKRSEYTHLSLNQFSDQLKEAKRWFLGCKDLEAHKEDLYPFVQSQFQNPNAQLAESSKSMRYLYLSSDQRPVEDLEVQPAQNPSTTVVQNPASNPAPNLNASPTQKFSAPAAQSSGTAQAGSENKSQFPAQSSGLKPAQNAAALDTATAMTF